MRETRESDDSKVKENIEIRRMTNEEAREYVKKFDKSLEESKIETVAEVPTDPKAVERVESDKPELELDEFRRLYFDEALSLKEISEQFKVPKKTILQTFKEHGWNSSRSETKKEKFNNESKIDIVTKESLDPNSVGEVELDPEEIRRLYYDEELTMKEIAEQFKGKLKPILRSIREQLKRAK